MTQEEIAEDGPIAGRRVLNSIKMVWSGSWLGDEYTIEINGKTYKCGQSGMFNLQYHKDEDTAARTEASEWLAAHQISTEEFDTFKEQWVFGGSL